MRLWIIFICFVIVQLGLSECLTIYKQSQKKPKDEIESHKVESKKHGKHAVSDKKSKNSDDFKKYGAAEYDSKSRSTKGDEGIESYDKTSSWEKKKKKAHHKKLGDEAKKSKSYKSSYHKDPDYYDDSEESHVKKGDKKVVHDKKHDHEGQKAVKDKIQHKISTKPSADQTKTGDTKQKRNKNVKNYKTHQKTPKSHKKYSEKQEHSKKARSNSKIKGNLKDHINHQSKEPQNKHKSIKHKNHEQQGLHSHG